MSAGWSGFFFYETKTSMMSCSGLLFLETGDVCPVCHVKRQTMSSWLDAVTELFSDKRQIDGR